MNVKDMLRQASDAAKQLITLSDQTIIGILKETAQVLRTHTEGGTRREIAKIWNVWTQRTRNTTG